MSVENKTVRLTQVRLTLKQFLERPRTRDGCVVFVYGVPFLGATLFWVTRRNPDDLIQLPQRSGYGPVVFHLPRSDAVRLGFLRHTKLHLLGGSGGSKPSPDSVEGDGFGDVFGRIGREPSCGDFQRLLLRELGVL